MIFDSDVLDTLYLAAEEEDFDILVNKIFIGYDYYNKSTIKDNESLNNKTHNLKIYQPELSCYTISSEGKIKYNEVFIWGKLIKASMYKSAINLLGVDIYSKPLIWGEDTIILYAISNLATSYKFIGKYCYVHFVLNNSNTFELSRNDKIYADLVKIDVMLDLAKKDCYNVPVDYLKQDVERYKDSLNELNQNLLKKIVYKIIYPLHIDKKYKKNVKNYFKNFLPNYNNTYDNNNYDNKNNNNYYYNYYNKKNYSGNKNIQYMQIFN